ncbi:MAG: pyrroline-5-carboxylate reductase [Alphaproteobacteria bacterium]|nr:pyrroline-5-carboxylate reductase [Alphaproteobacteria bacterium]
MTARRVSSHVAELAPLLLIGAGRMGGALLRGWTSKKLGPVIVVEPHPSRELRQLATNHRVRILKSLDRIEGRSFRACVLALKPQVLKGVAPRLRPIARAGVPVISIAAGTKISTLSRALGENARIIRAMPNIAGAIGRGISGIHAARSARPRDRKLAELLMSSLGAVVWLADENLLDAVTAISGSGPAYVFLFAEMLARAGEREGLTPQIAKALARATVTGAGALLEAERSSPAELRAAVTSPGGTTEAALEVLMAPDGLERVLRRAVRAARRRSRSLG